MKTATTKLWILLSIFLLSQNLFGVPATKRAVEMKQPDGTTLMVRINGDEHLSWLTAIDGYSIARNSKGFFEYVARIDGDTVAVLSGIRVSKPELRTSTEAAFLLSVEKHLRVKPRVDPQTPIMKSYSPSPNTETWLMQKTQNGFSSRKKLKTIVVPVNFADYSLTYSQAEIDNALNGVNYTGHGFKGSVRDYYHDMSGGKFIYEALVLPPYTANGNRSGTYAFPAVGHGSGSKYGLDLMLEVVDYVNAVLRERALSEFDGNNDGYIDHISVIFAGQGQELTGDEGMIWSNCSWRNANDYARATNNTIFTMISEIDNHDNKLGIATYCHEFGHAIGLPDLYDSDYETNGLSEHPGIHDNMSVNTGTGHPVPLSAFSRFTLGWYNLKEIAVAASISLPDMDVERQALRISTTTPGEFFVFENRQNTKWNVPGVYEGHGMLIFRVDSAHYCSNLSANKVNAYADHLGYDIVRADNNANNSTNTDFFPAGAVSFTDQTTPSMKSLAGINTGKPLTNITESEGVISFDLISGGSNLIVSTHNIERAGNGKVRVEAEILIAGSETCIEKGVCYGLLPTPTVSGNKVISDAIGNAFEAEISGLTVGATYYFRAYAKKGNGTAVYGSAKSIKVEEVVKVVTEYGAKTIPIVDISEMQNPVVELYTSTTFNGVDFAISVYPAVNEARIISTAIEYTSLENEDYRYKMTFELPAKSDYYKLDFTYNQYGHSLFINGDSISIKEKTAINSHPLPYNHKYVYESADYYANIPSVSIISLNTETASKPILHLKRDYEEGNVSVKCKTGDGEYIDLELLDAVGVSYRKIKGKTNYSFNYFQYRGIESFGFDEETGAMIPYWDYQRDLKRRVASGDYFVELPQAADLTLYINGISEINVFDYANVPVLSQLTAITNTTVEAQIIIPQAEIGVETGVCWYRGTTPDVANKIVIDKCGAFTIGITALPEDAITFNTYKKTDNGIIYGTPIVSRMATGERENKLVRDAGKPIEVIDYNENTITLRVWYDSAKLTGVQAQGICWGTNENVEFSANSLYEEGAPNEVRYFMVSREQLIYNSYDLYEYIRPFMMTGSNFIYDRDIRIDMFLRNENIVLDKTVCLPYNFINSNTDEKKYWIGNASIDINYDAYSPEWNSLSINQLNADNLKCLPDMVFQQSPIIVQKGVNNPQVFFSIRQESYSYNHLPVTLYAVNVITGDKHEITTFVPKQNLGKSFILSTLGCGDSIRLHLEMPVMGNVSLSKLEIKDNLNYVVNAPTVEKISATQLMFAGSYNANAVLPQVVEKGFVWSTSGDPLDTEGNLVGKRIVGRQSGTDIVAEITFEEVANMFVRAYVKDSEGLYSYSEMITELVCGTHTVSANYLPVTDNMKTEIYYIDSDGKPYSADYFMYDCLSESYEDGHIFYSGNLDVTNRPSVNKIRATVAIRLMAYYDMPDYSVYADYFRFEYRTIGSYEWNTLPSAYHNVYFDRLTYEGIGATHLYVNCIGELDLPRNVEQIRVKAKETWETKLPSYGGSMERIDYTESSIPDAGCAAPDMHALTVDNQQMKIIFGISDLTNVVALRVMRESQTAGVYDKIAELGSNQLVADKVSSIMDLNANPASRAYKYYLATVNAEGTEFACTAHKSTHLSINKGILDQWNLYWTHYEGLNVSTVRIYRGTSSANLNYLDEVPGTNNTYTDVSAPAGILYYVVELVFAEPLRASETKKEATKAVIASSRSNIVVNDVIGLASSANLSTLTVSKGILTPSFDVDELNYTVTVVDTISEIRIDAVAENPKASVSGTGNKTLQIGENPFDIVVTSEDNSATKKYTVTVIRKDNVGISNMKGSGAICVYPNPTTGKLIIKNEKAETEKVEIFDISGKMLQTFDMSEISKGLDISGFTSGMYFLKINGERVVKVIKE